MAADPLQQLEDWAAPLLFHLLSQDEQARLARTIARDLIRSQKQRIAQQRNPDGTPYAPRKKTRPPVNKPLRFLYDGPYSSRRRVAEVKSYRDDDDRIIGYDIEAGGIRTFIKSNMERFLPPSSSSAQKIIAQRGRIKAMFKRMRSKIRSLPEDSDVAVGIAGRAARIAEIHQFGLRDAVRPGGPKVKYPERILLGFTADDVEHIKDLLLDYLSA